MWTEIGRGYGMEWRKSRVYHICSETNGKQKLLGEKVHFQLLDYFDLQLFGKYIVQGLNRQECAERAAFLQKGWLFCKNRHRKIFRRLEKRSAAAQIDETGPNVQIVSVWMHNETIYTCWQFWLLPIVVSMWRRTVGRTSAPGGYDQWRL